MIAYLILAHENIESILNLVSTLKTENSRFFVHLDGKAKRSLEVGLNASNDIELVEPRYPVYWGGFSMVLATKSLVNAALKYSDINSLVLLSGSCCPVRNVEYIESVVTSGIDYMNIGEHRVKEGHKFYSRFSKYFLMDIPLGNPHDRSAPLDKKSLRSFLDSLSDKIIPERLPVHVGANWWCLTRNTAELIMTCADSNPWIDDFFKYSSNPDEAYFQTIAMMLVENNIFSKSQFKPNLHYSDFTRRGKVGGYPKVLDENDVDRILTSGKLFARKIMPGISDALLDKVKTEFV